jgi:general stress protein 26
MKYFSDLVEDVEEILTKTKILLFATLGDNGFPDVRAMNNLRCIDLYPNLREYFNSRVDNNIFYIDTNKSSNKVKQICKRAESSIYFCLQDEWKGLLFQGRSDPVEDPDIKKILWQNEWSIYYPGGVSDPEYTIIKFSAVTGKLYQNMKSTEFKI